VSFAGQAAGAAILKAHCCAEKGGEPNMNTTRLFSYLVPVAVAVGVIVGSLTPVVLTAQAAGGSDTVSIDAVSVGCDAQSLTFTGSATYSESTQHLVVTLDGVELFDDHSEPASWSTGPHSVAVGSHTLVATIYDRSSHSTMKATANETFTISACSSATTPTTSSDDSD
jgi:hypothetical protein